MCIVPVFEIVFFDSFFGFSHGGVVDMWPVGSISLLLLTRGLCVRYPLAALFILLVHFCLSNSVC